MTQDLAVDQERSANARATSHGYGAGKHEADRLLQQYSPEELAARATQLLEQVELAEAYAQSVPAPVEDYLHEVRAVETGTQLGDDRVASLATLYRAGFDVGFSATLVEGFARALGRDSEADPSVRVAEVFTPAKGGDDRPPRRLSSPGDRPTMPPSSPAKGI